MKKVFKQCPLDKIFNIQFGIILLLFIFFNLSFFSSFGVKVAEAAFAGGDGSEGSPYQIATCEQLQEMSNDISASVNYELIDDVDCDVAPYNTGEGFSPVGYDFQNAFEGKFNGYHHTITGLYINRPGEVEVGLFGYISAGGVVQNVGLISVDVTGYDIVGALAGYSSNLAGFISGVYSTGSVSGRQRIGGLIGQAINSTISKSYSEVAVVSSSDYVGGLVGYAMNAAISDSYFTGSVDGGGLYVGGIIGHASSFCQINNCYSTGSVTTPANFAGGLAGYLDTSSITNSYSTGAVTAGSFFGGLVGVVSNQVITNSYWDETRSGQVACYDGGSNWGRVLN